MFKLLRNHKFNRYYATFRNVWDTSKVVSSPFEDVAIPELTVQDYVWKNVEKWPTKTALVCGVTNRSYTYEDFYYKSRRFAANLRTKLNIKDKDVVGIMMPNEPEYPIVAFGLIAAGAIVTTMNSIYTAHEIQRQIIQSGAKAIVIPSAYINVIKEALKICKRDIPIICVDINQTAPQGTISYKEFVEDNHIDLDVLRQVKTTPDDVAFLPYSSGTTGLPKGVELTHKNLIANCEQQNTECKFYTETTKTNQDSTIVLLPMYHSYGLTILMLHKLALSLRLVTLPKFDPNTFTNTLKDYKINLLYVAPPTVLFMGSNPSVTPKHLESVRVIMSGAAPLPQSDIHKVLDKSTKDTHFAQGYGLTETSPMATVSPIGYKNYTCVGLPLPNVQLRVINEKLQNVGPNELGELLIKGPNVMKGYKDNPKANEDSFLDGDWLRSGDIATIAEDGAVTIADRLKELIKVKGYQVPPAELESLLREHPAVSDAAVIGVPDPKSGEVPRAFIVVKDNVKADLDEIKDFVSAKVAPYKRIKYVTVINSIPKNASGKILRKDLRNKYS